MAPLEEDLFYIGAELFFERSDNFAFGGEGLDRLDHGWHQVDLGIGGFGLEALEHAGDGGAIAPLLDVVESLELVVLDFGADSQQVAFAIVAFGELIHANDDALALVDFAFEAVRSVGDLAYEVTILDTGIICSRDLSKIGPYCRWL